ncbi:methylated-DNA--[protein]-cysteine S-methyltransferase [Wukongibacter baidiensis]|uniref:methylated-DNA--[protein]-cysteine S-methyltransferase n=1 Tax=Wukongibacter baidiensis TaxID=1723361 RepID=UPI003D7FAC1D
MANTKDMKVYYFIFDTSFGKIFFASTNEGLCIVSFTDDNPEKQFNWLRKHFKENNIIEDKNRNIEAFNQLEEYFQEKRQDFDLKLHLIGTAFQEQVWNVLTEIKFGEILTYKDVSCKLGDMNKSRAVGGAVGKNPIVVIVPCHRVIGSNGKLTGFSAVGGLELKKRLLDLEEVNAQLSF